jgi:tRNA/tmRNA/rRNA uracil-C5-methylase (TrmA/RlmC/RlmD family)
MRRNKPQPPIEKLTIDGIAQKGKGVGRTQDGQVVFVKGAIPWRYCKRCRSKEKAPPS